MKELSAKLIRIATSMARHAIGRPMRIAVTGLTIAAASLGWLPPAIAAPGSWTQKADMPLPTSAPASCVVDGILYVIGGHYPHTTPLRTVLAYNPGTDSWTRKTDMPTARRFLAAAAVDEIIYVVGGGASGAFPGVPLKTMEAYYPKTDTWVAKADMPTARQLLAACTVDGIIYVIGGGTDFDHPYSTVEAYDPKTNQWSRKRDLPKPLLWLTASVADGRVYAFAATKPMAEHPSETFTYDPTADFWTAKAQFSPWSVGLMSSTVDGIIYLFGGMTPTYGGHDFVLAYDPAQDRFTARRKMPRTRMTAACAAIDGKIYLAGGISAEPIVHPGAVYYRILDVFDPEGGVTPQILSLTCESTNRIRLVWEAEAGFKYGVESSPDILTNRWTRVTVPTGSTVTATNDLVETSCLVTPGEPRRFYRVLEAN